jgi:DNA polymerase III sliding clamp (beta) subunit (PCNA family)
MEVGTSELLKALKIVKPGLASREMLEQSTSFAFRDGRVITYNDSISISHPVPSLESFTGVVNSKELYALLDKINHQTIEITAEQNEIKLAAGRIKAGLTMAEEIRLPLDEIQSDKDWQPLPERFLEALKLTVYSCSNDASIPALTCIHITSDMVESSDGIRLTQFTLDQSFHRSSILIVGRSAKELIAYPITSVSLDENWAHFLTEEGTNISCRVSVGKYPDTSKTSAVAGFEVHFPARLHNVLERAEVFAERDYSLDEEVEIELSENQVKIRSKSESGWFEETALLRYKGEPVRFVVHPAFLKEVCQHNNTCIVGKNRLKFYGEHWQHIIALRAD